MSKDKKNKESNAGAIAIVAVVAIVSIIIMFSGAKTTSVETPESVSEQKNIVGEAMKTAILEKKAKDSGLKEYLETYVKVSSKRKDDQTFEEYIVSNDYKKDITIEENKLYYKNQLVMTKNQNGIKMGENFRYEETSEGILIIPEPENPLYKPRVTVMMWVGSCSGCPGCVKDPSSQWPTIECINAGCPSCSPGMQILS